MNCRQTNVLSYMAGVITVGFMALAVMLLVPPPVYQSAIAIEALELPPNEPVCPGDTLAFTVNYDVRRPTVANIVVTFIHAGTGLAVETVPQETKLRLHPEKSTVSRTVHFEVPPLPAGNYQRVAAVTSSTEDARPVFVAVPFAISEGCP